MNKLTLLLGVVTAILAPSEKAALQTFWLGLNGPYWQPTTWNFSPRDDQGVRGPIEQALIGVPVPDLDNPVNIVRVARSYDPCLACAIHLIDPETNDVRQYRIGW